MCILVLYTWTREELDVQTYLKKLIICRNVDTEIACRSTNMNIYSLGCPGIVPNKNGKVSKLFLVLALKHLTKSEQRCVHLMAK